MVMKKDGRKRDIKSKLVAAVCMLLVSCIMMVSSTYAWFTLSTAPEVTGITTAIGANGNLEMALLPSVGEGDVYFTSASDALAAVGNASGSLSTVQANTTWGNLVDLSDATYGLNKITLYPSTLEASGGKVPSHYLSTPKYGADGRYSGLGTSAFSAIHANGSFGQSGFGVRGVGTSSGMTALEIAYRDALSTGNTAFNNAIDKAKDTVNTGGSTLASMAVTRATDSNATFTKTDVQALITAYENMDATLAYVETALRYYIIADFLTSGDTAISDGTYDGFVTTMKAAAMDDLKTQANDTMDGYIDALANLRTTVSTNLEELNTLVAGTADDATIAWDSISSYVGALADINAMDLNGHPMSYWMQKEGDTFLHLGDLVGQMKNLVMEVNKGGTDTGLFAKLADFIDSFTTPVVINGISYNGISANGLEVTMKINATANPAYLPNAKTEANAYTGSPFGQGGGSLISDFYGYIIDMAFRTNAAGSNLQIQTDAVDRVYADNENNPATMGGGSTMTFTVPASGFTRENLANLMTFIRVVYFDPTTDNTIYCEARLDINTVEYGTDDSGNTTVTMDLKKWNPAGNDNQGAWATDSVITALDQNVAKAVSAMVYLEGTDISNEDIANANLTGKMNLQFASSAELKPMEYGDLRKEGGGSSSDSGSTVTTTPMTAVTSSDEANYPVTGAVFTGNTMALTITNADSNDTVKVTIGTSEYTATYTETDGVAGWAVTGITETLAADTAVTVTVTANP